MESKIITLSKFISRYFGVNGKGLTKLSHENAKYLFPNLKRSTFAFVDNHPKEVKCGNVVLVTDGEKVIPYYVPSLMDNSEVTISDTKIKINKTIPDYASMKIYELKKLLNVRLNGRSVSRQARHELEDRGVVLRKKYNREEFKKWKCEYERY